MRHFKFDFDFLYMVLRIISVVCYYNNMNGFSVRNDRSIYLEFSISSHCCASYFVLHDVLGFRCFMVDGYTIQILKF